LRQVSLKGPSRDVLLVKKSEKPLHTQIRIWGESIVPKCGPDSCIRDGQKIEVSSREIKKPGRR